jgi:hypothetical protein
MYVLNFYCEYSLHSAARFFSLYSLSRWNKDVISVLILNLIVHDINITKVDESVLWAYLKYFPCFTALRLI